MGPVRDEMNERSCFGNQECHSWIAVSVVEFVRAYLLCELCTEVAETVFKVQRVCVLCEVWAEAEETVEHGAQPEWSSA
jgi:hypothetical protein